jgi:two-component system cell cycle sensor histidine kinase/response regulator CckA
MMIAFGGRRIPARCVARRRHSAAMTPPRAFPAGRIAPLGANHISDSRHQGFPWWRYRGVADSNELAARLDCVAMSQRRAHPTGSRRLLVALLDSSDDAIISMTLDGTIMVWSRGAESVYGYTAQEAIGGSMALIVPLDRCGELESILARIGRGERVAPRDAERVRNDGSRRMTSVSITPIVDAHGAVIGAAEIARDVTERHCLEQALRASEAQVRLLLDSAAEEIYGVDSGVLYDAKRAFERTLGVRRNNALGRPIVDVVAEESIPEVMRRETGSIEAGYEFIDRHASGHTRVIEATAKNLTRDGQEARYVALRDITERRRLEQRVQQIQKMEALGSLAGGVAHDFNNDLTVISSFTELLLTELDVADPRATDLREVRKAVDSAASLTRQLLAFSRQQVIQPRLVALETEVQRAIPQLRRVIGEDLTIATELAERPTVVLMDASQLEQLFMNLCINARDAMPTGGTLTVQTARVTFDEEYVEDHWPIAVGTYAMLAISDTGVGMDAPTRARIFEPFFTTKEVGKRTGLGLATVYGIVKQNAGFVWVYSEPGKGSAFKVYFPLRSEPPAIPEIPPPIRAPMGTETILLVEDSQSVRAAAQTALRRFGYTVIAAPSASEALPWLDAFDSHIDLLVTDVVMPDMSGRELALHASAQRPHLKVLYISGYTDDMVVRHGICAGDVAYLQQPFGPVELARKVREVLDCR